jgi:hypothetical protein
VRPARLRLFAVLLAASCAPAVIQTKDFTLPLPKGYGDESAAIQRTAPQFAVALVAKKVNHGLLPTITVMKEPAPQGSSADAAACTETGNGVAKGGTLERAEIVDGPLGKTCQIEIRNADAIVVITELHEPQAPADVWLLTCNHGDGDKDAEARCRSTLAGFRFTR